MENLVIIVVLIIVFALSIGYVIKAKKNGIKCIGCSSGKNGHSGCSCGCCDCEDEK